MSLPPLRRGSVKDQRAILEDLSSTWPRAPLAETWKVGEWGKDRVGHPKRSWRALYAQQGPSLLREILMAMDS